jgi:ABC-type dipeptide/oligopeptide/nickel transport system permease component
LTATTALEVLFDLPGLGPYTLQALRESQVNWLMVVTIVTATGFGTLQLLADTWLRATLSTGPLRGEWTNGQ